MNHYSDVSHGENRPAEWLNLRTAHAVLAIAMLGARALITYFYAWSRHGHEGITASLAAAMVCWAGAALAMTATNLFRGPQRVLAVTAAGMALRMGLPLIAVMVVILQGGPLSRSGFVVCIAGYYAVALVVETWLTVKLVSLPGRAEAH